MVKKKIAFICVHNSCRSQIAEALGNHLYGDRIECYSAGTELKAQINQDAVRIVKEIYGIDMNANGQHNKLINEIPEPDIVISMGCDVGCPYVGRPFDDDWGLPDPTGKGDVEFRKVISEIEAKLKELVASMKTNNFFDVLKSKITKDKKEAKHAESLQARINISTLSYNTSVVIMDENGEFRTPPVPAPIEKEFLVKKGDKVEGFEIAEITTKFIVLNSFIEFTEGRSSEPKKQFIVEKGECINLNMYGVYDAVHNNTIEYVETVSCAE